MTLRRASQRDACYKSKQSTSVHKVDCSYTSSEFSALATFENTRTIPSTRSTLDIRLRLSNSFHCLCISNVFRQVKATTIASAVMDVNSAAMVTMNERFSLKELSFVVTHLHLRAWVRTKQHGEHVGHLQRPRFVREVMIDVQAPKRRATLDGVIKRALDLEIPNQRQVFVTYL